MRSPRSAPRSRFTRGLLAATSAAVLSFGLAACGGESAASGPGEAGSGGSAAPDAITVGALSNGAAKQAELKVSTVEAIRARLPEAVRSRGELVIGVGALPAGSPPISYVGTDQKTLTGSEPDLGRLVAATLGLKPVVRNSTWENLFVGIDSGKVDVAFTNVTVTEERKKKYEFASYRKDNLAFEVNKEDSWNFMRRLPQSGGQDGRREPRHQSGEDPAGVADQAEGRGQGLHRQVLPGRQQHLPGPERQEDRRELRPQPGRGLPRHPDRAELLPHPRGEPVLRQPARASRA